MNVTTIREFKEGSLTDLFTFTQVLEKLNSIGCESYCMDLSRIRLTVYGLKGDFHEESLSTNSSLQSILTVSSVFDPVLIEKALTEIKKDNNFVNFLISIAAAGVSYYQVFLKSGLLHYIGRNGDILTRNLLGFYKKQ